MQDVERYESFEPAWEDMDPQQRAAYEASVEDFEESRCEDFCSSCGKEFSDFSDLGCGRCDRRSPEFGMVP